MAKQIQMRSDEGTSAGGNEAEQRASAVCTSVLKALGRPGALFQVSAVRLWGDQFRVNVQTGPDAVSARIAHSYFVAVDEKGNLINSDPPITRVY